ncbi:hypothetical protein D3C75_830640 [compost metagenome]
MPVKGSADSLGAVFYYRHTARTTQVNYRVNVQWSAAQVNRYDCLCPGIHERFDGIDADELIIAHICQNGFGACGNYCPHRRDEGICAGDDFIAWPYFKSPQRQKQSVGA